MNSLFAPSAALAAATPLLDTSSALIAAARLLLPDLERGRAIDAKTLRAAMMASLSGSDTDGVWDWKTAYEACEAAQVLFLRKFGPAMRARANAPAALLAMLAKVAALLPSHTRRSEESQALQQFSTPLALGCRATIKMRRPAPAAHFSLSVIAVGECALAVVSGREKCLVQLRIEEPVIARPSHQRPPDEALHGFSTNPRCDDSGREVRLQPGQRLPDRG
jgi:hypothetical protein